MKIYEKKREIDLTFKLTVNMSKRTRYALKSQKD